MASRCACIGGRADYKKIEDTADKYLYDQMHERLKTAYAKKMKKQRQATVEPVLGTLINFMGVRRVWTRGLQGANKFMIAAAASYNLKKWRNHCNRKTKTAVRTLKKAAEGLYFLLLVLWQLTVPNNRKPTLHSYNH